MATKTIYLPDELSKRVEEHKDRINLSAIFQEAIERYLKRFSTTSTEQIDAGILEEAIKRLSREKDELKQYSYEEGIKAGRDWALYEATYEDLILIEMEGNPILPEDIDKWVGERHVEGDIIDYSAFKEGWFKGIKEVWLAMKNKI